MGDSCEKAYSSSSSSGGRKFQNSTRPRNPLLFGMIRPAAALQLPGSYGDRHGQIRCIRRTEFHCRSFDKARWVLKIEAFGKNVRADENTNLSAPLAAVSSLPEVVVFGADMIYSSRILRDLAARGQEGRNRSPTNSEGSTNGSLGVTPSAAFLHMTSAKYLNLFGAYAAVKSSRDRPSGVSRAARPWSAQSAGARFR